MPTVHSSGSSIFSRFRFIFACGAGLAVSATVSTATGADPSEKLTKAGNQKSLAILANGLFERASGDLVGFYLFVVDIRLSRLKRQGLGEFF